MGQAHANHLSSGHTKHFRQMLRWLRDDRGGQLSWGQLVREGNLERVLRTTGAENAEQVLQDMSRGRTVNADVYRKIEDVYRQRRAAARKGELGKEAQAALAGDSPEPQKHSRKAVSPGVYVSRVKEYLAEHPGAQVGKVYANVTGSDDKLRGALFRLHNAGELAVDGPWPPARGRRTFLALVSENGQAPDPVRQPQAPAPAEEEEAPEEATTTGAPSLASVRKHLSRALNDLEALQQVPLPNIPASAKDAVRAHYRDAYATIEVLRQELQEE